MDALEAARAQPVEALLAVLVALATAALAKLLRDRRRVASASAALATAVALEVATAAGASESGGPPVLVAYCTTRGRSRELAERLALALRRAGRGVVLVDAANAHVDVWDELLNGSARDAAVLISTAHQGRVPEGARLLLEDGLDELDKDFRVGRGAFKGRRFAVLGLGSSAYEPKHFCTAAKKAEKLLRRLGAARVASQCLDDTAEDDLNEAVYAKWEQRVVAAFVMPNKFVTPVAVEDDAEIADQESLPSDNEGEEEEDDDEEDDEPQSGVLDLEDIGRTMLKNVPSGLLAEPKEMVTASQAKSLKKEGYKLIGTHSAVKMCRWTKHQLRGRGGCYKHTFYGITSYQCMEATPSLACANKCTFCWRSFAANFPASARSLTMPLGRPLARALEEPFGRAPARPLLWPLAKPLRGRLQGPLKSPPDGPCKASFAATCKASAAKLCAFTREAFFKAPLKLSRRVPCKRPGRRGDSEGPSEGTSQRGRSRRDCRKDRPRDRESKRPS
ncbi:flavoprotein-like protein [Pelagophyceae sp. CCMP2097]|nr:flavoprotein-like protein [Pelagophyceae sp. CCMP2097]